MFKEGTQRTVRLEQYPEIQHTVCPCRALGSLTQGSLTTQSLQVSRVSLCEVGHVMPRRDMISLRFT